MRQLTKAALGLVAAALLAACGSSAATVTAPATTTLATPATTTSATTAVAPTTVPAATTTTVYLPSAPQANGESAAVALVNAWADGNQAQAATLAAPAAVKVLFAQGYPRGELQFRSCGQQDPLTCTYRNLVTDAIYEIAVVQTPAGGWYVQSVTAET